MWVPHGGGMGALRLKIIQNKSDMEELDVEKYLRTIKSSVDGFEAIMVDRQNFLRAECPDYYAETHVQFYKSVMDYTMSHMRGFITLCEAGNWLSAHHYIRLMSDMIVRMYPIKLFKGKNRSDYIDKLLCGKSKNKRYKGKPLTSEYILELIRNDDEYKGIRDFQKEGNRTTHFTGDYSYDSFPVDEIDWGRVQIVFEDSSKIIMMGSVFTLFSFIHTHARDYLLDVE